MSSETRVRNTDLSSFHMLKILQSILKRAQSLANNHDLVSTLQNKIRSSRSCCQYHERTRTSSNLRSAPKALAIQHIFKVAISLPFHARIHIFKPTISSQITRHTVQLQGIVLATTIPCTRTHLQGNDLATIPCTRTHLCPRSWYLLHSLTWGGFSRSCYSSISIQRLAQDLVSSLVAYWCRLMNTLLQSRISIG